MRLPRDDSSEPTLRAIGTEVAALFCAGDIARVVQHFGYAIAFDRDPAYAVWEDLRRSLQELGAQHLEPQAGPCEVTCKTFQPNDSNLSALVEIRIPTDNRRSVLVELIITAMDHARHITLEGVSAEHA